MEKSSATAAERPLNVLFLCTGNSARSIMAEALMTQLGAGRFRGLSAGSYPKGRVNPHVEPIVRDLGFQLSDFRSKSWDEFAGSDGPPLDFIFTVCDNAAGEACPIWPGRPVSAHWGIPDPAEVTGTEAEVALAFADAARRLRKRIGLFLEIPMTALDRAALQARLREIGEAPDSPP